MKRPLSTIGKWLSLESNSHNLFIFLSGRINIDIKHSYISQGARPRLTVFLLESPCVPVRPVLYENTSFTLTFAYRDHE